MTTEDTTQGNERVRLTTEQASAMIPEREQIHTFRNAGMILVGADWGRQKLMELIQAHGAELSGPGATSMRHGIVVVDDLGPLFIETTEENHA